MTDGDRPNDADARDASAPADGVSSGTEPGESAPDASELPVAHAESTGAAPDASAEPASATPAAQDAAGPPRRRRITLRGMTAVDEPPPRDGLRQRMRRMMRDAVEAQQSDTRKRVTIPVYALRVVTQVVRQWARDRCPQQAASLAFQTVLSIVPIVALTLATLRATGNLGAESVLVEFLAESYIPLSPEKIAATLLRWSENITFETLGAVGLVMTLGLAFVMFNTLERVMNDIWRTERRRPWAQKFIVFYAVATILPLIVGALLLQARTVGATSGLLGFVLSTTGAWIAGFLCIYVLPRTEVHVRAAAAGALVSALMFEAAKALFAQYAQHVAVAKYAGIYGALAIAPLLLIWIYYSWLVLLFGCEVAFAAQHLHLLERGERRQRMPLDKELAERVNGIVAARLMVAVCEAYLAGKKVLSRRALADRFDVSNEVVDRITARLKESDLLIEVEGDYIGLMPARHPHEIALADVLAAFRGDDVLDTRPGGRDSRLERVLHEIEAETLARTQALKLDELVDRA